MCQATCNLLVQFLGGALLRCSLLWCTGIASRYAPDGLEHRLDDVEGQVDAMMTLGNQVLDDYTVFRANTRQAHCAPNQA